MPAAIAARKAKADTADVKARLGLGSGDDEDVDPLDAFMMAEVGRHGSCAARQPAQLSSSCVHALARVCLPARPPASALIAACQASLSNGGAGCSSRGCFDAFVLPAGEEGGGVGRRARAVQPWRAAAHTPEVAACHTYQQLMWHADVSLALQVDPEVAAREAEEKRKAEAERVKLAKVGARGGGG
jgi:hypothetical protein